MTNGWEADGDSDIGDQKRQWDRLSVFAGGQATIRGATTASKGLYPSFVPRQTNTATASHAPPTCRVYAG
jgi:hypothetical protein